MNMRHTKQFWRTLAEKKAGGVSEKATEEFPGLPGNTGAVVQSRDGSSEFKRRDFLKLAGLSAAGFTLAGCGKGPEHPIVPYDNQPEDARPGKSYWYATVCSGCPAGCGMLAKNRDGRPIKLEGNPDHPLSRGGLCAVGQAHVLELYDSQKVRSPFVGGRSATWEEADRALLGKLEEIKAAKGKVRFLSRTITSPSLRESIMRFLAQHHDAKLVEYDALSYSAILDAHLLTHGMRALPHFRFDNADFVVGIEADFLGTWISPVEFAKGYGARRSWQGAAPAMSRHVQLEGRMSLTGSNADERYSIAPADIALILREVAIQLESKSGDGVLAQAAKPTMDARVLEKICNELWRNRGKSLVVCGDNAIASQILVNYINHLLGNYGRTLDIERPSMQANGSDGDLSQLLNEIRNKEVSALFVLGANPAYDLAGETGNGELLKSVPVVVSFSSDNDETSKFAHFQLPTPHSLETWLDHEPVKGMVSVSQPAIRPFGDTRSVLESLHRWLGDAKSSYDIVKEYWQAEIFPQHKSAAAFSTFWDQTLHNGYAELPVGDAARTVFNRSAVEQLKSPEASSSGLTLALYSKVSMSDGRHAHNAWLQEMPDPVSKVSWANYAALSPVAAERLGVQEGDVVSVQVKGKAQVEVPVQIQPGQHDDVVCVALGYGRVGTDRFEKVGPQWLGGKPSVKKGGTIGKNAAQLLGFNEGRLVYHGNAVTLAKTGRREELASIQMYHSLQVPAHLASHGKETREIVKLATLKEFTDGSHASTHASGHGAEDLWKDDHRYEKRHWGMAIDLNACTGCSACVVSCQVENNVPVVGKDEVSRGRIMHWLRVDRYYTDEQGALDVVFQPMMCQHCDHAPCETVCPVLATVHSEEGLNQQVYNRCVGTRYCSNNCPYKARRFNWFDYPHQDPFKNLVLNPDITIRSQGVMEKCSMCYQRISDAKAEAKQEGRDVADGEIKTACQQSCPVNAIVFGDMNDPNSAISKAKKDARYFVVLEELNVKPSVGYMTRLKNRDDAEGRRHG